MIDAELQRLRQCLNRVWERFETEFRVAALDVVGWMPRYVQPAPGGRDNG